MRRSAGQKAGRRLDQPMEKSRGRGHTDHADALCRALFAGMPAVGRGRHQDFVAPRETSSQLPKDDRDRAAQTPEAAIGSRGGLRRAIRTRASPSRQRCGRRGG